MKCAVCVVCMVLVQYITAQQNTTYCQTLKAAGALSSGPASPTHSCTLLSPCRSESPKVM